MWGTRYSDACATLVDTSAAHKAVPDARRRHTIRPVVVRHTLGRTDLEVVGLPVTELGLFDEAVWEKLSERAGEYPRARPEATLQRDGAVRYIGYSVTPLANAEEVRTGYVLIFQDLSEWRKLQEELRLKDRLAAVGELASGIAHEVGNPLAAISGSVQMLSQSMKSSF